MKKNVETERFETRGESGERYVLIEYTEMTLRQPLNKPEYWIAGAYFHETADGQSVNELDDGTYQILQTDEILRRID